MFQRNLKTTSKRILPQLAGALIISRELGSAASIYRNIDSMSIYRIVSYRIVSPAEISKFSIIGIKFLICHLAEFSFSQC